jgi:DNA repair photolyase
MGLNASKGNMYEFVTHTWNAIKGECPHGCSYCYMKRFGKQKPVRLDEKEFRTNLGTGNFIFVGSSCDMWSEIIPNEWIERVLAHCDSFQSQYLFQSKNPQRFLHHFMPGMCSLCTTIETNRVYPEIMSDSPKPINRAQAMELLLMKSFPLYVTIEPIMDFDLEEMLRLIKKCAPHQVNIGADTGGNNLPEPSQEKLKELISGLEEFTTIHSKRNLSRLLKKG